MLNTTLENIMITVTYTETRPALSVGWYPTQVDFIDYVVQTYKDTRTVIIWTLSPDMLSRTFVSSFTSQADRDTYRNDPKVVQMGIAEDTYNTANGITCSKTIS